MALLRGVFGGQADGILAKMQRLILKNIGDNKFPIEKIVEAFEATNKDLRFDEAYLRGLLEIQYDDSRCRSVMMLLFPEINENLQLDIDHLHPKSIFTKAALSKKDFLKNDSEKLSFYINPLNWNSIANLHLLNASQNRSKSDIPLNDWLADKQYGIKPSDLLLEESQSLRFEDFPEFCAARRDALLARLRANVFVSAQSPVTDDVLDAEQEQEVDAVK